MIEDRDHVNKQIERIRQIITHGEADDLEVEDGAHEHDAVEGDALLHEVAREARGAGSAIALAHEEEGRRPTISTAQVETNELANALDVALETVELRVQLQLGSTAIANTHGIDEDEVHLIQPRNEIVLHLVGKRGHETVGTLIS